jgi:hypothetical protein
MEQRPSWESNSRSASQEISSLTGKSKTFYCIQKSLPTDHPEPRDSLIQISILIKSSYLNYCLPSGIFSSYYLTKPFYALLIYPIYVTRKGSLVGNVCVNQAFCFLIVEALGRDGGLEQCKTNGNTWDAVNSKILKKWTWQLVNDCKYKSPISILMEFLNSCQDRTNTLTCSGIVLKSNEASVE